MKDNAILLLLALATVLLAACGRTEAAGPVRFQGLESQPMTRDQLIAEYQDMVDERCEKGWIAVKLSADECRAHVRAATDACDADAAQRMPERVAAREEAIAWAKTYSRCVLP